MKIAIEHLTKELFAEIIPLGQKSWDECSEIKGETCSFHGDRNFKIQPNVPLYLELQEQDRIFAMVTRDAQGVMRGFALCITYHSLHHKVVLCANVDTFYIEPEHRCCMKRFIAQIEKEFEERGVVVVGWPISPSGKLFEILNLLGYSPDDVVMEKRICALPPQS